MSKHTPRPWSIDLDTAKDRNTIVIRDTDGMRIADVLNGDKEFKKANAYLIAAAPELLEGMKSIEQRLLSFGINPHAILDTAQACIRQAEGKDE